MDRDTSLFIVVMMINVELMFHELNNTRVSTSRWEYLFEHTSKYIIVKFVFSQYLKGAVDF